MDNIKWLTQEKWKMKNEKTQQMPTAPNQIYQTYVTSYLSIQTGCWTVWKRAHRDLKEHQFRTGDTEPNVEIKWSDH